MTYQIGPDELVTNAVMEAIRLQDECDLDAGKQLYEVVDPDALNALFDPVDENHPRSRGRVSFIFKRCRVTIERGECITVNPVNPISVSA